MAWGGTDYFAPYAVFKKIRLYDVGVGDAFCLFPHDDSIVHAWTAFLSDTLPNQKIVFFLGTLMLFSVIIVSAFQMNFWLSNTLLLVYIGLIGYSERALLKRLVKAKAKVKA